MGYAKEKESGWGFHAEANYLSYNILLWNPGTQGAYKEETSAGLTVNAVLTT
jgi:hypothetical protein